MSDQLKRVPVRIAGATYHLITGENEQYTRQIGARADEMIRRIMQDNPQLGQGMATVLALVNAVDEGLHLVRQLTDGDDRWQATERKTDEMRRELMRLRDQNWELKKEVLRLGQLARVAQAEGNRDQETEQTMQAANAAARNPDAQAQTAASLAIDPMPESEPQPSADPKPAAESQPNADPQSTIEPQPNADPQPATDPQPSAESQPAAALQPETELKREAAPTDLPESRAPDTTFVTAPAADFTARTRPRTESSPPAEGRRQTRSEEPGRSGTGRKPNKKQSSRTAAPQRAVIDLSAGADGDYRYLDPPVSQIDLFTQTNLDEYLAGREEQQDAGSDQPEI